MMPNQPNKASKACKEVQGLRLTKGLKPWLHEARPKGTRGPKIVPNQAKVSLKHAMTKAKISQNEGAKS